MADHLKVVILDFGSQYTKLIARRVREYGIYSEVLPGDASLDLIRSLSPRALILSGGPASVNEADAYFLEPEFFEYQKQMKIPLLAICYGMQLVAHQFGGKIKTAKRREYGRTQLELVSKSQLFKGVDRLTAWMSHGDEVEEIPHGFELVVKSLSGVTAAIQSVEKNIYALQFHPEVTHTDFGETILKNFLFDIANLDVDWKMDSVLIEKEEKLRKQLGGQGHAICALSGGVDSAVAASLVARVMGERLHCVFVDHGMLRFRERERVMELFEKDLGLSVTCIDASGQFLAQLNGVTDPEQKRKIIGREFIRVFESFADDICERVGEQPKFLVQGTLYPDVIESSSIQSKFAHKIKSHHNVGGLPDQMNFELVEPLRDLFKDEVRNLGRELKVPESFLGRHPFPGPGLAVRILGEVTRERVGLLQKVDEIFIQSLIKNGLYDQIWQAFAVFLPIRTVGVQGDGRTHDHVVALRAVNSSDGMTADWFRFDGSFLAEVSNQICNEVKGINRVVYDVSSKPPATIEWE